MIKVLSRHWPYFLILIIPLVIAWPIFLPGYFSHHDDLQVMRIFEMRKCIEDFQIPCRWVPDMGYGNGYPLFNYYNVFPYYLGATLSFIFGFITSAKILFAIPIFLGAVSIYFLAKKFYGQFPAILASVLYTFAPYRALDTYVRGAVAESFAIAVFPLTLYFGLKLIQKKDSKHLVGLALSLAIFLTSHNIMALIFFPIFLLVMLFKLIVEKWKNLSWILVGIILGIGLSAFFVFPAYFEKNLVQIDNLIRLDLDFRAHFVTVNQLFLDRFWGYGASSPGTDDTISFQIGWPHWWIVVISVLVFLFNLSLKRKFTFFPIIFLGVFLISLFMTHIKSAFIWEKIEVLKFAQFPWRFLSLTIFTASLLGAYLIQNFKKVYQRYFAWFLIILTILLNWSYFKPEKFIFDLTDQQKLSGRLWEEQQKATILDYLPQGAVQPRETAPDKPVITSGKGIVKNFEKQSNRWKFQAKIEEDASLEVPVFDFPKWEVKVNNILVSHTNDNYLRRIELFLSEGDYQISGRLTDTPIRQASNIITILAFIGLGLIAFYGKIKSHFK